MIRILFILLALTVTGCDDWPPEKMFAPVEVPGDSKQIDPWIAGLLSSNIKDATQRVNKRLKSDMAAMSPIVKRMTEYVPCQVTFSQGVGHVRCVRRYTNNETGQIEYDAIYLTQPLVDVVLKSSLSYFDVPNRPLIENFMSRFAGSGEEMLKSSGNFTYSKWSTALDFGFRNEQSYGDWREARLLYAALNGDSVFIKHNGATAWHVLETDEMIPIAESFEGFIKTYADFRGTHEVFDSWAYRDFKKDRGNR